MAPTFYIQAKRWADGEFETRIAAHPDEWFNGFTLSGQPAKPSGVKRVCIDRLGQATVGLAAMPFGPQDAAAEAFSDAALLVPLDDILVRSVVTTHARLIDPFAGLGPDLESVPEG